jgi:hypothetical protein
MPHSTPFPPLPSHPHKCPALFRDPIPTMYSLEEELITCVGLAPAKPGVFMTAVKHVLVVCTLVQASLIGVCFCGDNPDQQVFTPFSSAQVRL